MVSLLALLDILSSPFHSKVRKPCVTIPEVHKLVMNTFPHYQDIASPSFA